MNLDRKRWIILGSCILADLVQGASYASSVFAKPMMEQLNCTKEQWTMAFSLSLVFLPVGMLVSGRIVDRSSPKIAVAGGAVIFGLGWFLAGFSNSVTWLYLTFGTMMSIGSGATYGAAVAVAVRWFPDRRGLASGLAVGALGFGTAIISIVGARLLQHFTVLMTFRILGIVFFVIVALAAMVISNPPRDYAPKGIAGSKSDGSLGPELSWSQMLTKPRFWVLYALYVFGAFSGLMVISQASPIAQEMAGLTKEAAAVVVMVLGLANASGRVIWGTVSDRLGRVWSLTLMFVVTMIIMFLMPQLATQQATLVLGAILIGACFGGYLGTFPSLSAESFGVRNAGVNYALLFSAFSIAAIAGPKVGARLGQQPGGYAQAFIVAGVIAAIGLLICLAIGVTDRRQPSR